MKGWGDIFFLGRLIIGEGELLSVGLEEGELEQSEILADSFSCDKCPAQLESKEILGGHRFTYHGVGTKIKKKKKYSCNLCKSLLKMEESLNHIMISITKNIFARTAIKNWLHRPTRTFY